MSGGRQSGEGVSGGRLAEVRAPTLTSRPPPVGAGIAMAGTLSSAHPTHLYTLTKRILIPQDKYLFGKTHHAVLLGHNQY